METQNAVYRRKIDSSGRLLLSTEVRDRHHISNGDAVVVLDDADGLRIRRLDEVVLTPAQFAVLAEMPAEREWLANIMNEKTKRAYQKQRGMFEILPTLLEKLSRGTQPIEHMRVLQVNDGAGSPIMPGDPAFQFVKSLSLIRELSGALDMPEKPSPEKSKPQWRRIRDGSTLVIHLSLAWRISDSPAR